MNYILTLFLIVASSAPTAACNVYAARDYEHIKIEERETTLIVTYDKWDMTLEKVITKPFGALQEAGVEEDGKTEHVFSRTKVDGKDAIIFSSMIFFPNCPKP
jgi:hypothetical protein